MIAEQLKALRHRDRLSQKELAKRLAVGQSTIAMWETGMNTPGYTNLVKLASLFNVSVGDLTQGPLIAAFDWEEGDVAKSLAQILYLIQQFPHTLSYNGNPLSPSLNAILTESISSCLRAAEIVLNAEHSLPDDPPETEKEETPDLPPESGDAN